jgi:alkylation response protein AidB-like acyl-CoA dehydrogenase
MDLQLTEEHKMIRDMAREFAQNEIAPVAAHYDETGEFPSETIKKMGAQGFMGIEVPEEYGGQGLDTISYVLAMIEIAKADVSHSTIVSVHNSLYAPILWPAATGVRNFCFCSSVPNLSRPCA